MLFISGGYGCNSRGQHAAKALQILREGKGGFEAPLRLLIPSSAIHRAHSLGLERSADSGPDFDLSLLSSEEGTETNLSSISPLRRIMRLPGCAWK